MGYPFYLPALSVRRTRIGARGRLTLPAPGRDVVVLTTFVGHKSPHCKVTVIVTLVGTAGTDVGNVKEDWALKSLHPVRLHAFRRT